jgi:hypothetical protein
MEQNMGNRQNSAFRYERKYFIYNMDRVVIEDIILRHPAFFSKIYYERYINNIYFDFLGFNNFMDNIDGNMYRTKYRVRWYGDMLTKIENPILELKIKNGLVGTKKSHQLNKFELENGISISKIKNVVKDSPIDSQTKFSLQEQLPVMLNKYKRNYYESNDKKFRITIDDEQSFYAINKFNNTFLQMHKDLNNVVVELKYDKKYESEAAQITNNLPFRLTKSSKYARGVQLLYS